MFGVGTVLRSEGAGDDLKLTVVVPRRRRQAAGGPLRRRLEVRVARDVSSLGLEALHHPAADHARTRLALQVVLAQRHDVGLHAARRW